MIRRRVRVLGLVQGVGYRYSAREQATRLQVAGFARNLPDGSVEIEVEGDEASVAALLEWIQQGPVGAVVDSVDIADIQPLGSTEFTIRH